MIALTDCLVKVSLVAPLAVIGVAAMAALTGLIVAIGALAVGNGALMDTFPQLEEFLDTGIPIIEKLGKSIAGFAKSVSGLDESSLTAMNAAVEAGKTLAEMASNLPNSGGLIGKIFGDNDIDTFGEQLVSFGISLTKYGKSVVDLNVDAINNSVPAAKSLSDLATNLPDTGGVWAIFGGNNDMKTFGKQLELFGSSLVAYGDTVSGLNVTAINGSIGSAKSLSNLAANLPDAAGWFETNDFTEFGNNLVSFGKSMSEYSDEVSGIDTSALSSATFEFQKVANMASGISDIDFSGVTSLGESLASIGKNAVDDFIKAFTDAYDKVSEAGSGMITKLVDGLNNKRSYAQDAFVEVVKKCVNTLEDYYNNFYNAGSYLVEGFADGINANIYAAIAKSRAMASAAAEAARRELDEHSPSKVGYKIGDFFGVAFVNAIDDYRKKSYNAGAGIADSAKNGLNRAISMVRNILNSDMDIQPTIRPVVDLDDVYSGVNAMNSMLSLQHPSVGVLSNVRSINYAMNRRNQNGGTDDVVSAINKLHKDLENVGGNTYNIEGITYDDGSNVSEAVSSLIRAARVERRV